MASRRLRATRRNQKVCKLIGFVIGTIDLISDHIIVFLFTNRDKLIISSLDRPGR